MRKREIENMVDFDINLAEWENQMSVTLDMETACGIVVATLSEQLEYLRSEQNEIESMESVPGYKQADYFANREIIVAIEKVLDYYGG